MSILELPSVINNKIILTEKDGQMFNFHIILGKRVEICVDETERLVIVLIMKLAYKIGFPIFGTFKPKVQKTLRPI